jgi:hypothetical protein
MPAPGPEKILLAVALAGAVASGATFGALGRRPARAPGGPAAPVTLSAAPYQPTAPGAPVVTTGRWPPPVAQARGREWIYDAFTPPEIFYNARTKQFTVKPPAGAITEEPAEPFGLELVGVRPEPFRLQLIGYAGGAGDWRGTFQNQVTGEVFLAAAGRRVPDLGLTITSLDVRPVAVALPQSMTTRQKVATAVVHDERTRRDVTLTHRARQFTGAFAALVAAAGEPATREIREREEFKLGAAAYRVEKIELVPPRLEVTKESPTLAQPDRRTLRPRDTDAAAAPADPPSR